MFSCADPSRPYSEEMKHDELGVQFMDDMYPSRAYETYGENSNFSNNMASRQPVEGTIPRGDPPYHLPYPYPNTPEGYAMAGDSLKNPIPLSDAVVEEGAELYSKFLGTIELEATLHGSRKLKIRRALARKGMTKGIILKILESQISDTYKKKKADFVINTSKSKNHSFKMILKAINNIMARNA